MGGRHQVQKADAEGEAWPLTRGERMLVRLTASHNCHAGAGDRRREVQGLVCDLSVVSCVSLPEILCATLFHVLG